MSVLCQQLTVCNRPQAHLAGLLYLSVEQQGIEVVKQPLLEVMPLCFADGAW